MLTAVTVEHCEQLAVRVELKISDVRVFLES